MFSPDDFFISTFNDDLSFMMARYMQLKINWQLGFVMADFKKSVILNRQVSGHQISGANFHIKSQVLKDCNNFM